MFQNLACYQIWLNIPVDHHQFGYSTRIGPKKRLKFYSGYTLAGRISRREYRGGRQNTHTHTHTHRASILFFVAKFRKLANLFFQKVNFF
jgi:hypothetical protein